MYSQNDEEEIILNLFSKKRTPGYFFDIGALDGKQWSNTRALVEIGWRGWLFEPSPSLFPQLVENCKGFYGVEPICCGVGPASGVTELWESSIPGYATTEASQKRKFDFIEWAPAIMIPMVGICAVYESFPYHPDLISIDTEGTSYKLFRDLLTSVFEPATVIVVEHDGHDDLIKTLCRRFDYAVVHYNNENMILVQNDRRR